MSSLGAKLDQLRRDAGAGPGTEAAATVPDLAARIDRLRRRPDRREELSRRLRAEEPVPGVLRIVSRTVVPACAPQLLETLGAGAPPAELRFVDTETTGLSGGTGTTVFLFGSGRLDGRELVVEQWLLTRPGAESAYWCAVGDMLGTRFTLVSYNGKSFDWPLMVTRQRLVGRRAVAPCGHIDLVHPVRRAFGSRWPDCRLATCEERLLRAPRRNDLGGEFAPWAYREFLAGRDVDPLCRIVEHHRQDIVSLARLLPKVAGALRDPVALGADPVAVARHWLATGDLERALVMVTGEVDGPARSLAADLLRRLERWDDAVAIWESLADSGDLAALEALAKFHEHRRRVPADALTYCHRLVAAAPEDRAFRHRLARVTRKAAANP